jgi:hypothetical protein
MLSFVDALTSEQMDKVIAYLRSLCTDKSWPRGEFNLPLAFATEKAFPEDEVVIKSAVNARGAPGSTSDIIYEQRFGARYQLEVDVPIVVNRQSPGLWYGGVGDTTVVVKRVLIANLHAGSILTAFVGVIVPSGIGLGLGSVTIPNLAHSRNSACLSFVQLQAGTDQPTDTSKAPVRCSDGQLWARAFANPAGWPHVDAHGIRPSMTSRPAKTDWTSSRNSGDAEPAPAFP